MNIDAFFTPHSSFWWRRRPFGTRLLAFVIFGGRRGRRTAKWVTYLGQYSPGRHRPAHRLLPAQHHWPVSRHPRSAELLCVAVLRTAPSMETQRAAEYLQGSTILYMVLVQVVFQMNRLSLFIGGAISNGPRFAARKSRPIWA